MTLEQIASRIKSAINNNQFLLEDSNTLANNDMQAFLEEVFGESSLVVDVEPSKWPISKDKTVKLEGVIKKANIYENIVENVSMRLEFHEISHETIEVLFEFVMPQDWQMGLVISPLEDLKNLFYANNVVQNYKFETGGTDRNISGNIAAKTSLCNRNFNIKGKYDPSLMCMRTSITMDDNQAISLQEMAKELFSFLGIKIDVNFFPSFSFNKISCSYRSKPRLLENLHEAFYLELKTDICINIVNTLSVKNIGFDIETYGDRYSFAFRGDINIGTSKLPLNFRYNDYEIDVFLDTTDQKAKIPGIGDICSIFGINATNIFPINFPDIFIKTFLISLEPDFKKINKFDVLVDSELNWKFFNIDWLVLKDIELGFELEPADDKSYNWGANISGVIEIGKFPVTIYAYRKTINPNWIFGTKFDEDKQLSLTTIAKNFYNMLFGKELALPIPEFVVQDTFFEFNLTTYAFDAETTVIISDKPCSNILDKLFNINATIKINSSVSGNIRNYNLNFLGFLEIAKHKFKVEYTYVNNNGANSEGVNKLSASWQYSDGAEALSIIGVLETFGVMSPPAIINDFNLSINSINMSYDFKNSILNINIVSKEFGEVIFDIANKDGKTNYIAKIYLKKDINLSNLPIVGTHMHLLDGVAIEKIRFIITSVDIIEAEGSEQQTIKSGAAILGKFCNEVFLLQLVDNSEKPKATEYLNCNNSENASDEAPADKSVAKWFKIEKSISVFSLHRLGVGYDNGDIQFLMDASLQTKPISMDMLGLGLGFSTKNPLDISFLLSGLGIDFKKDNLAIRGEFLKTKLKDSTRYDGTMKIQFRNICIFAVGSYQDDALFVYALLNAPIGGTPSFYITGLAAGFGYNENIVIPPIERVGSFPLVAGAIGKLPEKSMVSELQKTIMLSRGQNFLAAGIKFTSFKMIDAFALLIVSFGNELEIALLGLAEINVPFNAKTDPIAHAQLALKVSFSEKRGLMSFEAQLTSESYLLSKQCMLTGGFALYIWFGGEHKDDFVLSIGGYHASYKKPAHYPSVPRIGINWNVNKFTNIVGQAYFALTPSCVMAGGRLELVYQEGALKAWFIAGVDFIIYWAPLYYDASIYICVGASYRLQIWFIKITFTIELSASLHIWGPDFSGVAEVKWFIISFTINIGANASQKPKPISWNEFETSFLPQDSSKVYRSGADSPPPIITNAINITSGLLMEYKNNDVVVSVIRPNELSVTVKSSTPSTLIKLNGVEVYKEKVSLGVLPMGGVSFQSNQVIYLEDSNGKKIEFNYDIELANVPNALWGKVTDNDNPMIKNIAVGLKLTPKTVEYPIFPEKGNIKPSCLSIYSTISREFTLPSVLILPKNPYSQKDAIGQLSSSIMSATTIKNRNEFLANMQKFGFLKELKEDINLSDLGNFADNLFDEEPFMGVAI